MPIRIISSMIGLHYKLDYSEVGNMVFCELYDHL